MSSFRLQFSNLLHRMTDPKHLLTLRVYLSALLGEGHRGKSRDTLETFSHSGITFIFFLFLIFHPSAPVLVRGCCPEGLKPLPLAAVPRGCCSHPHLAATLVLGGVCELGSSPHQQTKRCKKRVMISQPAAARPGAKDWAEAVERGWISPATAQLHPGIVPS